MVETKAAKRARELENIVADKSITIVTLVLNPPPLISRGIFIISIHPKLAHSEEYFARTYNRRLSKQSGVT